MRELQAKVAQFMHAGAQPIALHPCLPEQATRALSMQLIEEELQEMKVAIAAYEDWHRTHGYTVHSDEDAAIGDRLLSEVADAQADLLYVVTWATLAWGFPIPLIMEEVQRANMDKFSPGSWKDENGKVRKPPDWQGPNVVQFMHTPCIEE